MHRQVLFNYFVHGMTKQMRLFNALHATKRCIRITFPFAGNKTVFAVQVNRLATHLNVINPFAWLIAQGKIHFHAFEPDYPTAQAFGRVFGKCIFQFRF